jgi:hypothetical protein
MISTTVKVPHIDEAFIETYIRTAFGDEPRSYVVVCVDHYEGEGQRSVVQREAATPGLAAHLLEESARDVLAWNCDEDRFVFDKFVVQLHEGPGEIAFILGTVTFKWRTVDWDAIDGALEQLCAVVREQGLDLRGRDLAEDRVVSALREIAAADAGCRDGGDK